MRKQEKEISITLKNAKKIASTLDSVVVSLDRLGSNIAIHNLSPEIANDITNEYYVDFKVFDNLAKARKMVFEALEKVYPNKFVNGIKGTKYWQGKKAYEKYYKKKIIIHP